METEPAKRQRRDWIRNFKLVIFDFSGVLSRDIEVVYETNMRLLEEHGHQRMSFEDLLSLQAITLREFLRRHQIVFPNHQEQEKAFKRHYGEVVASGLGPTVYPDAQKALARLRDLGKPMAIVSAHPREYLEREIELYGIRQYFSLIYGSTTESKAEALTMVCREMKVNPRDAAFIGDTIFDVNSARTVGIHTMAVASGYNSWETLQKAEPEVLASSLTDLLQKLGAWD